jgi:hypothetical protein
MLFLVASEVKPSLSMARSSVDLMMELMGSRALHSISAWAFGLRVCKGLNSGDDESNEIPAAQELSSTRSYPSSGSTR